MRHLRLSVAVPVILATFALLGAAVTVVALHRSADQANHTRDVVVSIQLAAASLSGLEWQAIADRTVSPKVAGRAHSLLVSIDRSLVQLDHPGAATIGQAIGKAERAYERAVKDEFQLLDQGRVTEARAIDGTRTDPAFEELRGQLQSANVRLEANVHRSHLLSDVGTIAAMVGGLLALLLFSGRRARDRRRGAEQALRSASDRKLRSLVEHGSDVVAIVGSTGVVTYAGGPTARVLGVETAAALVGRRLFSDLAGEDEAEALLASARVANGAPVAGEVRTTGGRVLAIVAMDLSDDPGVNGIVVNLRDVSATRRLEEELRRSQRLDAVGKLAGGIAHDFNNLLTAIRGYCDLLAVEIPSGTDADRKVQGIVYASERAAELTKQLLAFGIRQMLQPKVIDLNEVALRMQSMLRRLIPSDIELVHDFDPRICSVRADPSQLEQVILNLVVNARDAMPDGGKVTIATRDYVAGADELPAQSSSEPATYVELVVTDTGAGMDEHTRAHAFEPFFTTKEMNAGTGLGLATVYGIVRQSGGQLVIESEPGAGTTIRVLLPSAGSESPAPSHRALESPPQRGTDLVLLVDDNPMVRTTSASLLENMGYTVLVASCADEALELVEEDAGQIALVITDIVMPRMSGVELAARLRDRNPHTLVLFISGYSEDAVLRRGTLPDDHLLQKPFSAAELGTAVRAVLDQGLVAHS